MNKTIREVIIVCVCIITISISYYFVIYLPWEKEVGRSKTTKEDIISNEKNKQETTSHYYECKKTVAGDHSSEGEKYWELENEAVFSYKKVNPQKDDENYIVQVWDKQVYSDLGRNKKIHDVRSFGLQTEGYDKLSEENNLMEFDCKRRMYRILSTYHCDKDGNLLNSTNSSKGVFNSLPLPKEEWESLPPNSRGDFLLKQVCPNR